MEKKGKRIDNHPLSTETFEDIHPLLQRCAEELKQLAKSGRFQIGGPVRQLPEQSPEISTFEQYLYCVFDSLTKLASSFERSEHIRAYLAHFRILKRYKETGINRAKYIQYHYSNHATTLVGTADLGLILTNDTFRLGLPHRQCRQETIVENSWVCNAGVDKILQRLNSAVQPLREPRNLFIHRGVPRSNLLLSDLSIIERVSERSDLIEQVYKIEVPGILRELNEQEGKVFDVSMELLSGLHPIYKFWKGILSAREKSKQ